MPPAGPLTGLRSDAEITARARALIDDADAAPIAAAEVAVLDRLLALEAPAEQALPNCAISPAPMPAITPAVDRFEMRLDALSARGIDVETLPFEASHGQSTLEYYDGFVFSFHHADPTCRPWPPAAAMTR